MNKQELNILLNKLNDNTISVEEKARLDEWDNLFEHKQGLTEQLNEKENDTLKMEMWDGINSKLLQPKAPFKPAIYKPFNYVRWVAAAVFFALIAGGSYLYFKQLKQGANLTAINSFSDVAPGGNKAILTLANGKQVVLDSVKGIVANEGGAEIVNADGKLQYGESIDQTVVSYNTITTPRGGQYQLVLSDGSKVWLNAASSLKFPAAFNGNTRSVELTGEGYFEIAKDAAHPFHIKTVEQDVEVLGTHFNINAYPKEKYIKTTLLEGSIKIEAAGKQAILKPGQQANIGDNLISIGNDVDTEQAVAWKNGLMVFHSADAAAILREIERWYNVDVEFKGELPKRSFFLEGTRKMKLSEILRGLEVNHIRFEIDGENKKLIVYP